MHAPESNAALASEASALLSIFEGEDDLDLSLLMSIAKGDAQPAASPPESDESLSPEELEDLMRSHFGLPRLDVKDALRAADQGNPHIREQERAEDDFSEEEWIIVRALRRHVRRVIQPAIADKSRNDEIRWCFMRGTSDKQGVSFHLACQSLRARPFVVQTLLQHYWHQRAIVVGKPFEFLYDPLPDPLQTEALYFAGTEGLTIASRVWSHPSIHTIDLARFATQSMPEARYLQVVGALEESGLICGKLDRWYVTSRKPAFRKFRRQSWSASFVSDY